MNILVENKEILSKVGVVISSAIFANINVNSITNSLSVFMEDALIVTQFISALIALTVGILTIIKLIKDIRKK